MKKLLLFLAVLFSAAVYAQQYPIIADHNHIKLEQIPSEWIDSAKAKLHIAYQHTSHGSQISEGLYALYEWKGDPYRILGYIEEGALHLEDYGIPGAYDLGNPNFTDWVGATRSFLKNPDNSEINVVMWSWCGQVSWAEEWMIQCYLDSMTVLENEFPDVKFVYMTGHLDGTGEDGNLNQRNEQIRNYVRSNNKILFDFADIESYDPDGNYYLNKGADDACNYDSDGDGYIDANWAQQWQGSHEKWVDWFEYSPAHSEPINGNMKTYAAWWLWAALAGWDVSLDAEDNALPPSEFSLEQNYPNPFNPTTTIRFSLPKSGNVKLTVFNLLGQEVATLLNEHKSVGNYEVKFNAEGLSSGVYIYRIESGSFIESRRMMLVK